MKMKHIKLVSAQPHLLKHHDVMGKGIVNMGLSLKPTSAQETNSARVMESPLANSVTSWP